MSAQKPYTRTRTGCHTCREAGYKCDEQKPFCRRCTRLKITCKGYGLKLKWKDSSSSWKPCQGRKGRKSSSPGASSMSPTSTSSVSSPWTPVTPYDPKPALPANPELCALDKRLMHYWNERLAQLISVSPRQRGPGPFQLHLTAMATDQSALQSTILSMAANHLALISNHASWKLRAFHHQQQAIIRLRHLIQDPMDEWTTAEPALATVLMMQISTRLFSKGGSEPQVANHLVGAKAMVSHPATLASSNDTSRKKFLLSLFAYHDILSSISRGSRPLLEHTDDFIRVEDDPSLQSIAKALHVVARISELQELVKQAGHSSAESSLSGKIAALDADIEKSLLVLDNTRLQEGAIAQSSDILFTAEAFRHAAFIYLYRVWLNIGSPARVTMYHANQCLACIEQVPIDSSVVAAHLWPLWTAGCEAIGDEKRNFVRNRCLDMFRTRLFPSWKQIVQDIEDVWAVKDLEKTVRGDSGMTKIDCIQVIKRRGREVELA